MKKVTYLFSCKKVVFKFTNEDVVPNPFFVRDLILESALSIGLGVEFVFSGIHCGSPTQSGWSQGPSSVSCHGDIGS